jgi:glutathione S-transferase
MMTLHAIAYSPWSERARWALLHHGVEFREKAHVSLVGELALRFRSRKWRGPVSVPLLVCPSGPVLGSRAIAEYADRCAGGSLLFPPHVLEAIRALDDAIEPLVDAGRTFALLTIKEHDDVAVAALPPLLRKLPFAAASARLGSSFVGSKFGVSPERLAVRFEEGLRFVEAQLGGRDYVHGGFSYADILCASALQFVKPVDDRYIRLEPALRRRWTQGDWAFAFPALFEWRDALYAKHRPTA